MRLLLCVFVLFISGIASGEEITGFKSYELGRTTLSDVQASSGFAEKATGYYCYSTPTELSDQTCSGKDTIAGAPASLYLYFFNEKLEAISLKTGERRFFEVVAALTEKYGKPTEESSEVIQNRAGASFDNKKVLWKKGQAVIEARQRAGSVDTCSINFFLNGWYEKVDSRVKEFAKKKSKDL